MTGTDIGSRKRAAARAGLAACSVLLLALHVVGGYFVLLSLLTEPEGPWDTNVTRLVRTAALSGIVTEAFAAAVTAAFVAIAGLRRWWYAVPVLLVLTAAVRMVFAPEA